VGSPARDAGLLDGRAAAGAGFAGPGKDLELVLVPAGLAEGVVVGVEGGAAEVYGAAEYVAGGGVYLPRPRG
jgi:hypothetical protein